MTIQTKEKYNNLFITANRWLLILLAFSVPFPLKTPLPVLWLIGLFWLCETGYLLIRKEGLKTLYTRFTGIGNPISRLSFFLLIILYIIGVAYSENIGAARFELEKKSLMLLFPLVFFTMNPKVFYDTLMRKINVAFLSALLVISLYLVISSWLRHSDTGNPGEFFYSNLSLYHHPAYISLYMVFGIGICLEAMDRFASKPNKRWMVLLTVLTIVWLMTVVILLGSKAGFLSLIILFVWFFVRLFRSPFRKFLLLLMLIIVALFFVLGGIFSEMLTMRLKSIQKTTEGRFYHDADHRADGIVMRVIAWDIALQIWSEAPFAGSGTGDYYDRTREITEEGDLMFTMGGVKNAHNQYLQTAATIGIPGLIALLLWLFYPMLRVRRTLFSLHWLLILLVVFNLLWESMLEVQAGVLFITYFHLIFFITSDIKKKPAPEQAPAGV